MRRFCILVAMLLMAASTKGCAGWQVHDYFDAIDRALIAYDEVSVRYDDLLRRIDEAVQAYEQAMVSADDAKIEQALKRWRALHAEAQMVYDEAVRIHAAFTRPEAAAQEYPVPIEKTPPEGGG